MCLVLKNLVQYIVFLNKLIPFILPCSGGWDFFFNRSASDGSFSSRNLPWFPLPRCSPYSMAYSASVKSKISLEFCQRPRYVNQDSCADAKLGSLYMSMHFRCYWSLRDLSSARAVQKCPANPNPRPSFAAAWALMRNRTQTKPLFLLLLLFLFSF